MKRKSAFAVLPPSLFLLVNVIFNKVDIWPETVVIFIFVHSGVNSVNGGMHLLVG